MNLTFLIGCFGTRLALAIAAKNASVKTLTVMGYMAFLPVVGWILIYTYGLRKTGIETGGKKIWWNSLRPIHAALWTLFAYLAIIGSTDWAWSVLLADAAFGMGAYLAH